MLRISRLKSPNGCVSFGSIFFKIFKLKRIKNCIPFRPWHHISNKDAVVIAAAVRTPAPTPGTFPSTNIKEEKLASLVIDELVKRTSVPHEEFKKLFMCSSSQCSSEFEVMAKELGLKSCETYKLQEDGCSVEGLQMTLESLRQGEAKCIITGDSRCQGLKLPNEGVLASELMTVSQPVVEPKKADGKEKEVPSSVEAAAAALAWTTYETAKRLQLQPLALVREFLIEENREQALYCLSGRDPINPEEVQNWEMVTVSKKDERPNQRQRLVVPDTILGQLKPDQLIVHDATKITASHLLTHLVHSLPAGALGCAIMDTVEGRHMVLILEKLAPKIPKDQVLPKLTLYTKEPCPLCDDLLAQLEDKFAGQFELEKVFIDKKENVRYLRLFRHDIPVLFFNGQFLCMHKLNEEALTERLAAFKNGSNESQ